MRPLRRLSGPIESAQVRALGRSVLSVLFREQVLVLETTGRKSGRLRRTTLAYRELDGDVVVIGGAGGQTRPPDWVANLRANPKVRVSRHRQTAPMVARVLEGDERLAAWIRLLVDWPRIATYERRSGYPIPVIVLAKPA